MEFGGIYLDRDVLVFKSLDPFRKFEMTLDYQIDENSKIMGSQVQIAHKRARFLRLYLQTYKKYEGKYWYWNAGGFPTERIINKYPHLVHSMNREFGLSPIEICDTLYLNNIKDWAEKYFTVHSFIRNNNIRNTISWCFSNRKPSVQEFDEQNIKTLNNTFGQMARHILYNTTDIID
jgi:hypothetical protein